jgi:hypothetical protein
LLIKRPAARLFRVLGADHRQAQREDIPGVEARLDLLHADEAADQQARADEQH